MGTSSMEKLKAKVLSSISMAILTRVISNKIRLMDLESIFIHRPIKYIKVTGTWINSTARGWKSYRMAPIMMATSTLVKNKATVSTTGLMELCTKGIGKIMKCPIKENSLRLMAANTMECIKMESSMVRVNTLGQMEGHTLASIKTIRKMVMDSTSGQMAKYIRDFGKMEFNMAKVILQILMVN